MPCLSRASAPAVHSNLAACCVFEERLVLPHKIANARRFPFRVIASTSCVRVSGVEAGHGQEVFKEMPEQIAPAYFLVTH